MSLPNSDPSLPSAVSPIFQDNSFVRADHARANNQAIWGNLEYLLGGSPTEDFICNKLTGVDTTDSSGVGTGAAIFAGGMSIAKKLYVGTDLTILGNSQFDGNLNINGIVTDYGLMNLKNIDIDTISESCWFYTTATQLHAPNGLTQFVRGMNHATTGSTNGIQVATDNNANLIAFRAKSNSVWSNWKELLHADQIAEKYVGHTGYGMDLSSTLEITAGGANIAGGITVTSSGLTISAGGANISGGVIVSNSGLTVSSGGINITGTATLNNNIAVSGLAAFNQNVTLGSSSANTITANAKITGGLTIANTGITVESGGIVIGGGGITVSSGNALFNNDVTINGNLLGNVPNSGTWTPSLTGSAGWAANPTPQLSQYSEIDGRVTFTISLSGGTTNASGSLYQLSLPVASNFSSVWDAMASISFLGLDVQSSGSSSGGSVSANIANNTITVYVYSDGSDTLEYTQISGSYLIK